LNFGFEFKALTFTLETVIPRGFRNFDICGLIFELEYAPLQRWVIFKILFDKSQ